jgi:hypothetical protein
VVRVNRIKNITPAGYPLDVKFLQEIVKELEERKAILESDINVLEARQKNVIEYLAKHQTVDGLVNIDYMPRLSRSSMYHDELISREIYSQAATATTWRELSDDVDRRIRRAILGD